MSDLCSRRAACTLALALLALSLAACSGVKGAPDAGTRVAPDAAPVDGAPRDATPEDGASVDAYVADADALDAGDPIPLIEVSAPREFRAVWVASVSNLDFPSRSGLSASAARAELAAIVERTASAGLNAIVFQVRPESDALYSSSLEPWSRVLTGTQGGDPGYDPLTELLTLAHARGVEVHAWLNPYRGLVSASASAAPNHVTRTLSAHAIRYGSGVVMDPGAPAVRAHVVAVVADLARRYDVDGVHFDDYFYPYPDASGTPFPDDATYTAYRDGGGALSLGDWRRENVNALVREVRAALLAERPAMRFGISPFGIYRPGMPEGIRGLDAYATIYCDAKRWMDADWVDYVAPQLYWPTTQAAQAFVPLLTWWGEQADAGEHVFAGHALYRLGSTASWTRDELLAQVQAVRDLAPGGPRDGQRAFPLREPRRRSARRAHGPRGWPLRDTRARARDPAPRVLSAACAHRSIAVGGRRGGRRRARPGRALPRRLPRGGRRVRARARLRRRRRRLHAHHRRVGRERDRARRAREPRRAALGAVIGRARWYRRDVSLPVAPRVARLRALARAATIPVALGLAATSCDSPDDAPPRDAGASTDAAPDAGPPTALRLGPPARRATLGLPPAHDGVTPLPLVVLLHGYGASAAIEDSYLGLSRAARERGVYVLLPNGTPDAGGDRFWAATRSLEGLGVDDVAYLAALLDEASATVPVDPARVSLLGHSNGAFMAYRFACAYPARIAALAALAGTEDAMPVCETLPLPVSALHFHGTADDTILYEGGEFRLVGPYVSAEEMALHWARRSGCADTRTTGASFDWDGTVAGPETIPFMHDGCPEGVGVELWRMEGAAHIPSPAPGATARVLDWLLAHPRSG